MFKHNVDNVKQHEEGSFKHHSNIFGQHAAGHKMNHDYVKNMCGGGMAKGGDVCLPSHGKHTK
jgi:hypothetical protein